MFNTLLLLLGCLLANYSFSQGFGNQNNYKPFMPKSGIIAGTSYTAFDKNNSIISSDLLPYISFPVRKKIYLNVAFNTGISVINNNTSSGLDKNNTRILSNGIFVSGNYFLNEKVTVSGSVIYKRHQFITDNQNNIKFDEKDLRFGLLYKVSENLKIYGEFGISNYYNPYFNNVFSPFSPSNSTNKGF